MSVESGGDPRNQLVLHFLGIDGETSKPFYPPWTLQEVRDAAQDIPLGDRDVRRGIDAENPAEAGWGVIFAADVGEDVRSELKPLLDLRREQAGDRFQTHELPLGETLDQFRRRIKSGVGLVSPERLPYYLLLVGDPEQISFDFQYDLDVQHAVGRLTFPDAASYGIYANAVCEHESRMVEAKAGLHLYSFDKENDVATDVALKTLVRPLAKELEQRKDFAFHFASGADATSERFAESVLDGPQVVFTVGHSYLTKPLHESQGEWQGSLITGSHRGGKIQASSVYRAANVPDDADLCGRIFYLYGCHTVGTPKLDSFDRAKKPRQLAHRSFVTPLAQRLLAPPKGRGALAVVGQVDRAFPYASMHWDESPQIDSFVDALQALCDGVPAGRALETFGQRYASVAVEILRGHFRRDKPTDPVDAWTAYHDARAVALLGDPLASVTSPKKPET